MLRESQNRIRSMALIHQTLYESKDFAQVDFGNFLDSLVPTLVSSYGVGTDRVHARRSMRVEVLLPINAAIPCGLVVNELISNALKHAFPGDRDGEITIDLAPGRRTMRAAHRQRRWRRAFRRASTWRRPPRWACSSSPCSPISSAARWTFNRANPTRFALRFPHRARETDRMMPSHELWWSKTSGSSRCICGNSCRGWATRSPAMATSGEQALQQIRDLQPDVVLMDIHIEGDIDGIETAARIPPELHIPVIYLTAYSEEATLERARDTSRTAIC